MGRSTPLQWIQQYQRWYCYACKEYAPSTTTGQAEKVEEREINSQYAPKPEEDWRKPFSQYLAPGERIIDSSDWALIKPHQSAPGKFFGEPGRVPPSEGPLVVTDRRIYLVAAEDGFAKQAAPKFEAIYDFDYAKQRIESAKEQGYPIFTNILTELDAHESAEVPASGLVGSVWERLSRKKNAFLLLKIHYVEIFGGSHVGSLVSHRLSMPHTWEVWPGPLFGASEPLLLQKMNEKIQEISGRINELEAFAA
jgi:hypothetical protein